MKYLFAFLPCAVVLAFLGLGLSLLGAVVWLFVILLLPTAAAGVLIVRGKLIFGVSLGALTFIATAVYFILTREPDAASRADPAYYFFIPAFYYICYAVFNFVYKRELDK